MSKATITELVKTLTALALSDDDGERQRLTDVLRKLNEQLTDEADKRQITLYCRPIRFNEKDVARMPKTLTKANGIERELSAHVRKRAYVTEDNGVNVSYEIRYRKSGFDVTATAKTLARAKHKFIHKLFCIYCIKGANNNE